MAKNKKRKGVVVPQKFNEDPHSHSTYILNRDDEADINAIIHEAVLRELREIDIEFVVHSTRQGHPKMLLCSRHDCMDFMLVSNDLDWFVKEFMEKIDEADGGIEEPKVFLELIAKAFGFVSEAAIKKLKELKDVSDGQL